MTLDLRHAVIDGPDGTDACVLPPVTALARALREQHGNAFWCARRAGGCGGRLELAAGPVRPPYFRHKAGEESCPMLTGPRTPADAYYHLAYQRALDAWLRGQGLAPSIEHTFSDGGGRADLHVVVEGRSHSLEVQLSRINSPEWRERDERYRRHVDHVTWLHGPGAQPSLTADFLDRGLALEIRTEDGEVELGVQWDHDQTDWAPLDQCVMTADGIWSPVMDEARAKAVTAAARREEQAEADRRQRDAAKADEERRRREQQERDQAARDAWARRAAQDQARRQEDAERYTAAGGVDPRPSHRTFDQWERLHPEIAGWALTQDWSWLAGFDETEQRAGKWMAYVTCRLYGKAMIDDLRHPELTEPSFEALVEALFDAGLARMEDGNPHGRWERVA